GDLAYPEPGKIGDEGQVTRTREPVCEQVDDRLSAAEGMGAVYEHPGRPGPPASRVHDLDRDPLDLERLRARLWSQPPDRRAEHRQIEHDGEQNRRSQSSGRLEPCEAGASLDGHLAQPYSVTRANFIR